MKQQLRKWAKEERKKLDFSKISENLVCKLMDTEEYQKAKNIMLFYPKAYEVNLLALLDDKTKNFYLPKIQNKEIEYDCKIATVTDYKPIRKDKLRINKNMFIIPGVSIISFAAIYLLLALYFNIYSNIKQFCFSNFFTF